ncbi:MAG: hypothetical protein ABW022_09800 [Actinoplanes sp.]
MAGTEAAREPIGDPDENGDFAEEHESTVVGAGDPDDDEPASPGGLDSDEPPVV